MSSEKLKIHFIGIGGIGVSALAQYYLAKGHKVSGSDLVSSEITDSLKKKGVKITIGRNTIPKNIDLLIYSPAVKIRNLKTKIPALSYPQALGELTKKYFTIAVCGSHGKSTVAAMIGILLQRAGLDPTVIIGTKLKEFGDSNCRIGNSQYLVIEADEHFASFLNYWPKIIVITNIEADHLDYYKNIKNIKKAFNEFVSHLPEDGALIDGRRDFVSSPASSRFARLGLRSQSKLRDFVNPSIDMRKLRRILKIPGEHNVFNALAALAVARVLKIPDRISFKALASYKGSWRRFEEKTIKLNAKRHTLISDYGHHPTQIKVTLKATKEKYPRKKIWCVYQPHQYQRTYYLFNDFVKVFRQAAVDKIIITDIYDVAGREEKSIKQKVNSEKLVRAVKKQNVIYLPKQKIIDYLKKNLQDGEVVIVMGAGDIYNITLNLTERK